jgi:hypothetical protein
MDKIKKVMMSPLVGSVMAALAGGLLLIEKLDMYGGIAIGMAIMMFMKAARGK